LRRGQGSIVVGAIVLLVALSFLLAVYISSMNSLAGAVASLKDYILQIQMVSSERLNVSVQDYVLLDGILEAVIDLTNIGSQTLHIHSIELLCLDSLGYVEEEILESGVCSYYLNPGASAECLVVALFNRDCYSVTVVFVTDRGNSFTAVIP